MLKIKKALEKYSPSSNFTKTVFTALERIQINPNNCYLFDLGRPWKSDVFLVLIRTNKNSEPEEIIVMGHNEKMQVCLTFYPIELLSKLLTIFHDNHYKKRFCLNINTDEDGQRTIYYKEIDNA